LGKPNSAQTALDLLVLTVLDRRGPLHGYGIASAIEDLSQEALRIEEGSLYRRSRFYEVTSAGKKQLLSESERWASFSAGVARVLRHA
jgi:PadR family transcriptional regulator, regulatory protein PadR